MQAFNRRHTLIGTGPYWGFILVNRVTHLARHAEQRWKSNRHYALNIVISGQGRLHPAKGQTHLLEPGCVYQHFPADVEGTHEIVWESDRAEEIFILIDREFFDKMHALIHFPQERFLGRQRLDRLLPELERYAHHPEPTSLRFDLRRPAISRSLELMSVLFDHIEDRAPARHGDATIQAVCGALDENPADRTPLPALARRFGVSYTALRKRFKRAVGLTLLQYRIHIRMNRAQSMLAELTVAETADRLGYPDAFVFSTQFKKITSMSPSEYQQRAKDVMPLTK